MDYRSLAGAAGAVAEAIRGAERVAIFASQRPHTAIGVLGALLAGVPVVPLNPKLGERELTHIRTDAAPALLLCAPGEGAHVDLPRHEIDPTASGRCVQAACGPEDPALIVYTSGTTGAPKGVVQPRRSVEATVNALAEAWEWSGADVVVHALPLFHVHGLVLGTLGPVLLGGGMQHIGRFDPRAAAEALAAHPRTMLFGVPTMYTRIAEAVEADPALANRFAAARLLVSGSAPLPATVHRRITAATGQAIVERYGLTETFMNTSVRIDGERRPGTVGLPLDGVAVRVVDDAGREVTGDEVGEVEVRGPNVFREYRNRPEATAEAFRDGWFRTGDMATRDPDGYLRLVGRRSTDLIKSGGYRIGAGEIENVLLEHAGVAEAAVTGEPDEDLGERIVAWIVPVADIPDEQELVEHVTTQLTPHKRPRAVRFLEALPRNEMGKVLKRSLG